MEDEEAIRDVKAYNASLKAHRDTNENSDDSVDNQI